MTEVPNKQFQVYTMPEEKVKGNHIKWEEKEILVAPSRRQAVKQLVISKKGEQKRMKYRDWKVNGVQDL